MSLMHFVGSGDLNGENSSQNTGSTGQMAVQIQSGPSLWP
jgi:hypothetical protein